MLSEYQEQKEREAAQREANARRQALGEKYKGVVTEQPVFSVGKKPNAIPSRRGPKSKPIATLAEIVRAMRQLIRKNDGRAQKKTDDLVFEDGTKINVLTLVYAIKDGRITGLPLSIKTYGKLKSFIGVASPHAHNRWKSISKRNITVRDIFNRAAEIIRDEGVVPDLFYEGVFIDKFGTADIGRAMQSGAIEGLEDFNEGFAWLGLDPQSDTILINDFYKAAGLAEEDAEGRLVPTQAALNGEVKYPVPAAA